jgi:hypothetical protein
MKYSVAMFTLRSASFTCSVLRNPSGFGDA